ncbi:hypothetical protein M378DRAFT_197870 [Amanita muscaria Koide BX008]|uniref:Uncharacterized protein n=1 Tax=Amanita muscaria (strain Koide BX008) TaxID=946122 RepID=A0A0C2SR93_AMAMK|nr:hypothetical protein M378DRAFT_197870 [Amanita muscaria Koide BX008]
MASVSLRSLRESALSLSDLAGLKRGDPAPRRSCNIRAAKSPQGTNSAKSTHSSYARQSTPSLSFSMSPDTGSVQSRSRWRSPSSRVDQPIFRESPSDNTSLPSFASSLSPLWSDFSSLGRIEERIRDGQSSPFRYVPSSISRRGNNKTMLPSCSLIAFSEDGEEEIPDVSTQSGGFHLEDLSDPLGQFEPDTKVNRGEESFPAYSDLKSPFRFTSPPDYHVVGTSSPNPELRGGNHRSLLLESDAPCSRSPTNDTSPFTWLQTSRDPATPSPHYDCDQSPRLGNGSPAWLRGCIFDYEDPWDAIGIIMGLSPNNPNKVTLEEELAIFGADEFGCATAASDDAGCNNALEDYSDERTSCTMFSPARSWVDTTQKLSGSSCISHCNNARNPRPGDACRSPEPTNLADVSTGCLIDGEFMAHELPDCFDEADLDSALTCYGTISPSCTKSPVVAPSPHWPLSPTHTISTNGNHFPLLSYDRQSERSPNMDFVAEEEPEPYSVTIVPSPERPSSPIDTTSFTRYQLPLVGDDGRQIESHSDNNVGIEPSLTLAYSSSSAQPAEDLNSHTIKECFRGLRLFHDDSDAEST